jgi:hypothetical protein
MMMRSVVDFQNRAATIDRSRLPVAEKREQLEALRKQALETMNPIVVEGLDRYLKDFCRDVYQGKAPPSLIDAGPTTSNTHFKSNGKQLAAVMFFQALSITAAERAVAKATPELSTSTPAPTPHNVQFAPLDKAEQKAARAALEAELKGVISHDAAGAPRDLLTRLNAHPGLSAEQRTRVLDTLSLVKVGFERAGAHLAEKGIKGEPNGQLVNWKHTRLEMDRVLDAALAHKLSPTQTEDALLASMFSDSVKAGPNFIVHNVHGAQAALKVLSSQKPALGEDRLKDIVRVTLEHQIGPPAFMGMMAEMFLKGAGVKPELAASIRAKLAAPLNPAHQTPDKSQLKFSADEKAALEKIGVKAWTVPPPGARHEATSRAVIEADSMVNYACPDGWAKLIELHGPNTMFDKDTLLSDAVTKTGPGAASALTSFKDAESVVSKAGMPVYDRGRDRSEDAFSRTMSQLHKEFGTNVPFLDVPLKVGDAKQTEVALRVRTRAAELMRAEELKP